MELQKLGWIIVIVLVLNKISFASSVTVKVGSFRYLHRHPKLKSCAGEILKENLYVGCRVHVLTGECEGLKRSWLLNQTVQSGYAYAKTVSAEESYIPPLENTMFKWTIPGVLRDGATVALMVEVAPDDRRYYDIYLYDEDDDLTWDRTFIKLSYVSATKEFEVTIADRSTEMDLFDKIVECTQPEITKEMKISFRAYTERLEVLVDDHEICTVRPAFDLTTLRNIAISVATPFIFHGFEFIDV